MAFLRITTAYLIGIAFYMVAAVTDVLAPVGGIEAVIGLPIQFVIGSILVFAVIGMAFLAGWPLRLPLLCRWTKTRLVLCGILTLAGIVMLVAARFPANLVTVPHPELGMQAPIQVGNPMISIAGFIGMIFGIVNAWLPDRE